MAETLKKDGDEREPPMEFRCPISGILMENPVVVESGQSFEEVSIQWIRENHMRFPKPSDLVPGAALIPNHLLKEMIDEWRQGKLDFPVPSTSSSRPTNQEPRAKGSRERLVSLLRKLPCSSANEETAVMKELRFLTSGEFPDVPALFGNTKGAVNQLLNSTSIKRAFSDASLTDDLVKIVLNISDDDTNKRKIVNSPAALPFLVVSMRSQSVETRRRAVAAVSALSTVDANRRKIGDSGAIEPLVEVIKAGDSVASRDATLALLNLCKVVENRGRAVSAGAVVALVEKMISRVFVDEMLPILGMLSSDEKAIGEMEENGMLHGLFMILRKEVGETSKEDCVSIIHAMCHDSVAKTRKINEVEKGREILEGVASSGTKTAIEKASQLLLKLCWADLVPPRS